MKWSDIFSLSRQLVEGSVDGYETFSDAQLDAWGAQCVKDLSAYSRHLQRRQVIAAVAGTGKYTLPSDAVKVRRVTFDGDKLGMISLEELRAYDASWETYSSTPRHYYVDELNGQFGLYGVPSAGSVIESMEDLGYGAFVTEDGPGVLVEVGVGDALETPGAVVDYLTGNGIEVFYQADAPTDIDWTDYPALPGWAHPLCVYYVCMKMRLARTQYYDPQDADFWNELYTHGKQRLLVRVNTRNPGRQYFMTLDDWGGAPSGLSRLPRHITDPEA